MTKREALAEIERLLAENADLRKQLGRELCLERAYISQVARDGCSR